MATEGQGEGVLIVASDRRILDCDARASRILDDADALAASDGYLTACRACDDARLRAAIELVATAASGRTVPLALSLPRRSGRADYLLALACSRATNACPPSFAASGAAGCVVIVIHDFELPSPLPIERLQHAFGLTAAQARVAARLAAGDNPKRIATALGVSLNTVRTHLRVIYGKTATAGQAQLMQRVAVLGNAMSVAAAIAALTSTTAPIGSFAWMSRCDSQRASGQATAATGIQRPSQ